MKFIKDIPELERAKFEKFAKRNGYNVLQVEGAYVSDITRAMFGTWCFMWLRMEAVVPRQALYIEQLHNTYKTQIREMEAVHHTALLDIIRNDALERETLEGLKLDAQSLTISDPTPNII